MKKLKMLFKLILLLVVIFPIGIYIFNNYVIKSPKDIVEITLKEFESGNKVIGLTDEQAKKIIKLFEGPKEYGLPKIDFNLKMNHEIDIHLTQHTSMRERKINSQLYSVVVSFDVWNYTQPNNDIEIYAGKASFQLEQTGWNSWRIIDVQTTEFKAASEDGSWSGTFN